MTPRGAGPGQALDSVGARVREAPSLAAPLTRSPAHIWDSRHTAGEDPPLLRDRSIALVVAITLVVGLAALAWSHTQGLVLLYNDAASHLNIARRVFDSRTPGLVQLGTVWLPVPHVLLLPFVASDALWRTGLAGSVVGLFCLVVTAATLFASVRLFTRSRLAAWLGLAVLLSNPNLLYLQTTALTEPVLLMTMTASAYFVVRWSRSHAHQQLMLAGALAALAVGSRYDGWFFAVVCAVLIAIVAYVRTQDPVRAEGLSLAYLALPVYAMLLWFLYNWLIFGDPLAFARGEFSAAYQQEQFARTGNLPTKYHLGLALLTYSWAVIDNAGDLVVALAALGLAAYLWTTRGRPDSLLPYAFLTAFPFNVLSLWLGQTVLFVPESEPPGYFNVRYGLVVLPGLAVFVAYLADRLRERLSSVAIGLAVGLVLLVQLGLYVPSWPLSIVTVADGVNGLSARSPSGRIAEFVRDHYDGGGILIDDSIYSPLILKIGIPIREYIATFSGDLWRGALRDPTPYVEWVVMRPRDSTDRVQAALINNPRFVDHYAVRFEDEGYAAYERVPPADQPGGGR